MTEEPTVARAGIEDLDEVVAILSEAARWLLARGIVQWPDPFPPELIAPGVERDEVYLAQIDGKPAATVTLQWEDPAFCGERPPDAGYVHRLAVRREYAGRGLGSVLLDWAEGEVRAEGRSFVRLDCMRDNPVVRGYYEALGFERRGERDMGSWAAALYERRVRMVHA